MTEIGPGSHACRDVSTAGEELEYRRRSKQLDHVCCSKKRRHVVRRCFLKRIWKNASGDEKPLHADAWNRATSFLFIAMKCVPAVSTSSKTPIQRGADSLGSRRSDTRARDLSTEGRCSDSVRRRQRVAPHHQFPNVKGRPCDQIAEFAPCGRRVQHPLFAFEGGTGTSVAPSSHARLMPPANTRATASIPRICAGNPAHRASFSGWRSGCSSRCKRRFLPDVYS